MHNFSKGSIERVAIESAGLDALQQFGDFLVIPDVPELLIWSELDG